MRKYNADFILVCENRIFGSEVSIGARLSKGGLIPWLKPVDIGPGPLRITKELRNADRELTTKPCGKIDGWPPRQASTSNETIPAVRDRPRLVLGSGFLP